MIRATLRDIEHMSPSQLEAFLESRSSLIPPSTIAAECTGPATRVGPDCHAIGKLLGKGGKCIEDTAANRKRLGMPPKPRTRVDMPKPKPKPKHKNSIVFRMLLGVQKDGGVKISGNNLPTDAKRVFSDYILGDQLQTEANYVIPKGVHVLIPDDAPRFTRDGIVFEGVMKFKQYTSVVKQNAAIDDFVNSLDQNGLANAEFSTGDKGEFRASDGHMYAFYGAKRLDLDAMAFGASRQSFKLRLLFKVLSGGRQVAADQIPLDAQQMFTRYITSRRHLTQEAQYILGEGVKVSVPVRSVAYTSGGIVASGELIHMGATRSEIDEFINSLDYNGLANAEFASGDKGEFQASDGRMYAFYGVQLIG